MSALSTLNNIGHSNNPERGDLNPMFVASSACGFPGVPFGGDEWFQYGTNKLVEYNNKGGSAVKLRRIVVPNANEIRPPNPRGACLEITSNPEEDKGISPELGGFVPNGLISYPNGVMLNRFTAKLPVGYAFHTASNATGENSTDTWLGPVGPIGTGKWEQYVNVRYFGCTGTFGSTGYIYVTPTTHQEPCKPLVWHVASSEYFLM